jgi:hypothetical protein
MLVGVEGHQTRNRRISKVIRPEREEDLQVFDRTKFFDLLHPARMKQRKF